MSTLVVGLMYGGATLATMFIGMPIAFALGAWRAVHVRLHPSASLDTVDAECL